MSDIFCQIINKELPAERLYEDDEFLVIPDKFPKAPTHLLFLTKKHIPSVAEAEKEDATLLGRLILLGQEYAKQHNITDYQLVFNTGVHSAIPHLHMHLRSGHEEGTPLPE